jgi:hypothetical protein
MVLDRANLTALRMVKEHCVRVKTIFLVCSIILSLDQALGGGPTHMAWYSIPGF